MFVSDLGGRYFEDDKRVLVPSGYMDVPERKMYNTLLPFYLFIKRLLSAFIFVADLGCLSLIWDVATSG